MKQIIRKFSILLIAVVLLSTPFASVLKTEVSASGSWTRLSDEDFANDHNSIDHMVKFGSGLLFSSGSDLNMFYSGGSDMIQINTNLADDSSDNSSINGVASGVSSLYVSTSNFVDGDQIYRMFSSTVNSINFTNITSSFPDTLTNVKYLTMFGGDLFMLATIYDGESYVAQAYLYDGSSWTVIGDNSDLGLDLSSYYIADSVDVDGCLYVLLNTMAHSEVWAYQDEVWTQVGGDFDGASSLSSIMAFGDTLYISTINWSDGGTVFKLVDGNTWVEIEDATGGFGDSQNSEIRLIATDDSLFAFTTRYYGGYSHIYVTTDGDNWDRIANYIGVHDVEEGSENAFVTAVQYVGSEFYVATGYAGEGPYHAILWKGELVNDGDTSSDNDGDGINDTVEDAGPNGGDANNDGTADSEQPNVTTMINPVTGNYVVLQNDGDYTMTMGVDSESTDNPDAAFSYPAGLMHFSIQSGGPGQVVTISQYFYGDYDASLITARKYNETTHTYTMIPGATIVNITIGGQNVLKVSYQIEDGSALDQDGTVDGIITDPSGPAMNSVVVPNTGLGGAVRIKSI